MRRILLSLAFLALAGCAARATRTTVAARDLLGPYRTAVRTERGGAALPATTFAIEADENALPPGASVLVGSLLERRGWTVALDPAAAEARFELADGVLRSSPVPAQRRPTMNVSGGRGFVGDMQLGLNGSGDVLYRNRAGRSVSFDNEGFEPDRQVRRLEVAASSTSGDALWTGLAWIDARRGEYVDDLNDLALALADRLPVPKRLSEEYAAVDRIGADFVMILDPNQQLVPVLLAIAPGSASARAGWTPRDVVLSIDGEPASGDSWSRIANRLATAESRPVEVELLRAGERYLTYLVPATPRPLS